MRRTFEISDFLAELNVTKLSAVEKVKQLKEFLDEKRDKIDKRTEEIIEEEIDGFQDIARFETTTPW